MLLDELNENASASAETSNVSPANADALSRIQELEDGLEEAGDMTEIRNAIVEECWLMREEVEIMEDRLEKMRIERDTAVLKLSKWKRRRRRPKSALKEFEGCFVTKITLCDSALNNSIAQKSFSKEEDNNIFVTEKDVALSGKVFLKSDIGDRKSVALCRRLRARLVLASSSEGEEKKENSIVDVAEDCSFFSSLSSSSSPSSPPPIDALFFCDGAGPLSVACNANERLRSRKGGEESRLDHQRQQLQQRPIFVYCTVEHHGSDNNSSHSGRNSSSGGGGGEVGTIFVDDGSGYDVDEEAEKNSGDDKATASKALYDALRPQFTALFANALDEAGAGNVDEDENRRRERRAALH
ncbi:unnamed protein product [Bathycoccus prasinos]